MKVKCLAKEDNAMTRPGLEPGPLHPESSGLTTRPPRLPQGPFEFYIHHFVKSLVILILANLTEQAAGYATTIY